MRGKRVTLLRFALLAVVLSVAAFFRCGGGGGSSPQSSPLAGAWDVVELDTGAVPGWARFNVTLDGSGNIALNSGTDSSGFMYSGPPLDVLTRWEVDSSRTVREFDTSVVPNELVPSLHGTLASNERLVVVTDNGSSPLSYTMLVARKRDPAVAYSDADIRGKAFAFHQLNNGADSVWEYGYGSLDASGNVSIDNVIGPAGPSPGYPQANIDTISVDSAGIVTNIDNTFYGMLTTDKSTLFALITEPLNPNPMNRLIVIQFLGQTYAQSDLGGSWDFHALFGNATPGWLRGTFAVSPITGSVTYDMPTYISDFGPAVPPSNETLAIGPTGTIVDSLDPDFHGQMSSSRNLYVRTQSLYFPSATRYSIGIVLK